MELIRDFQRAWVCLPAQSGPAKLDGLVTNLSVSGAQLHGIAPLEATYQLEIQVTAGTVLSLTCKNMWVKADQFGCQFINLSERDLFLLRALVWAHRREDLE